ncbi:hypothetical protein X766_15735 [Mesorhizobium sp. LSJC255A00]|nr:hypothetical protein X766_15735 [Mesorhizobium sp. LSJC255A00]
MKLLELILLEGSKVLRSLGQWTEDFFSRVYKNHIIIRNTIIHTHIIHRRDKMTAIIRAALQPVAPSLAFHSILG